MYQAGSSRAVRVQEAIDEANRLEFEAAPSKCVDTMTIAEVCEAIEIEGAHYDISVHTLTEAAPWFAMISINILDAQTAQVWMLRSGSEIFTLDELRAGLRRWMSLRGAG